MQVFLEYIKLSNFKNYLSAEVRCNTGITCLVGKNGMGKTNFLDAVYYLCMTKSHFSLPDSSLILHNQDFFRLEARFQKEEKATPIVAKYQSRKKKVFEKNKVPYQKLAEHIGFLPIVMIAPDDSSLAFDGSEVRRKFIDNTLSQIDQEYLQHLMLYNKLLKQRNALLKKMGEENRFQPTLLKVYDEQMQAPAEFIFEKRQAFSNILQPVFQLMHEYICQKEEVVQLEYKSQLQETPFQDLIKQAKEKDRILQRTTVGIHKDDFIFKIGELPLKKFASQGQLKSYILSLKLSQYEIIRQYKKVKPILLLDDIFDKLDQFRVRQLLKLLIQPNFGQIFITDTNPNRVANILQELGSSYQELMVEHGKIEEIDVH